MNAPAVMRPKVTTLLDAALAYHEQGWPAIPVDADKRPLVEWGHWRTHRQAPADIQGMPWDRAHGIAILTWPASNLVVVDFDGPHATTAWQTTGIHLPDTGRTRTRSGGAHGVYCVPESAPRPTQGNGREPRRKVRVVVATCDCAADGHPHPCGVDLLLNGYFIVPPTPGYTEDPDHPLDPSRLATIPQAVLDLARDTEHQHAHAEVVTPEVDWYMAAMRGPVPQGQRNDTASRLAGLYLAKRMSVDYVVATLTPWALLACVPPMDLRELRTTVESIARREAAKPTFADDDETVPLKTEAARLPELAWRGVFSVYREAMREATHAPEAALFAGLWAAGAACLGRRTRFYLGMEVFPNVALAVYGETGDGKTTATRHGIDRLHGLTDDVGVLRGSGSGEGVVDWLTDPKAAHLWYAEEYSEILIRAGWDGATIKSVITSLYDCPPTYSLKFKKGTSVLTEPTLSLLVCTTPATFWKYLHDEDMESGFGNRWLYVAGTQRPTIPRPTRPDGQALAQVESTLARLTAVAPMECYLAPTAEPLWDRFYRAWEAEAWSPLTRVAVKRVPQYILKLSMLYAALEGTAPTLTAEQLTAAIVVGDFAAKCTDRLMRDLKPGGFRGRLEKRILEILTVDALPTYKVCRQVGGGVSVEDVDRAIKVLVRAGEVEQVGRTKQGRPVWGRVGVDYGK